MLLVGEAFGESEDTIRQPFVGSSGKELWRMLSESMPSIAPDLHVRASSLHNFGNSWVNARGDWLAAAGIAFTNVLNLRPPGNRLDALCTSKALAGKDYPLPGLAQGKYLRVEYLSELERLYAEIASARPNLLVALGNTACWALLRATNIGSIRGAITTAVPPGIAGMKVLPSYHPAAVMRQWSWRPIVVADLMKASREAEFPEVRRPRRLVQINPTMCEIRRWYGDFLYKKPELLAADIETGFGQIKCISFAYRVDEAITIPFFDEGSPDGSYWANAGDEREAWGVVKNLLESDCPILGQNFLYDLQYLVRMGIRPRNCVEDTMLLHHSHFPEMQKGLGFLGSIYSSEASWKLMRRPKADTEKRDE